MQTPVALRCTAFVGDRRVASGELADVAVAVRAAVRGGDAGTLLAFDDVSGQVIDLDLRGSAATVRARYAGKPVLAAVSAQREAAPPRGPGRPKLGVVAREVTLLPRHWDWLAAQPGGASVSLRKLVEQARRANAELDRRREAREATYRVIAAIAGDARGFENASRALFAEDKRAFFRHIAAWPADVRDYIAHLAAGVFD